MDAAATPTAVPPPPIPPVPAPPPPPVARRRPHHPSPPTPPSTGTRIAFLVVGGALTTFLLATFTLAAMNAIAAHTDTAAVSWEGPVRVVRIETAGGSVDLRGTEGAAVRGTRRVERGLQAPTLTEHVEGDTLVLTTRCDGLAVPWCSTSYTLDVPRSVHLEVSTGTGGVTVRGTTGGVTARTGTGRIEAWDLEGPLAFRTGLGSIEARDLRSDEATTGSGAGSVLLSFSTAPRTVTTESGAGRIDVLVPRDGTAYRVEGDSGAGGRQIEVPTDPSSGHVIRASSGAGHVFVGQRG